MLIIIFLMVNKTLKHFSLAPKLLVFYSVIIFAILLIASVLIIQTREVQSTGVRCSGAGGSGAECNSLGYPSQENHMWGCYDRGSGFFCESVPANSTQGLPNCFMNGAGQWLPCGCDIGACQQACIQQNAGRAPGHYLHYATCSGCGQNFTCGCDISSPPPTPTSTPQPTPSPTCPSTQARFFVEGAGQLVNSGSYVIGQDVPKFEYSVLINMDTSQFFQGKVTLSGPFGNSAHNNGNTRSVPQPFQAGTYTLEARLQDGTLCDRATVSLTNRPIETLQCFETGCNDENKQCASGSGLVCLNNRCVNPSFPENETCEGIPGINISKVAVNGAGPYDIGQIVPFVIRINNTGQLPYSTLSFRDTFNHSKLQLVRILNEGNGQDISSYFTINNSLGTVSNNDLTVAFGDLQPNSSIGIRFEFRSLTASNWTCNDVFLVPNDQPEINAQACVAINNPPPTDI